MSVSKRLYRVNKDRVFLGVCTGIAEYLEVDVSIIRIVFVVLALTGVGVPVLIYLIMGIILPIKEIEI
ncbi:MAG: PspC domain-containing protein, partial [Candidatus Izimaplasma sp.]|nr:PspC domain-containing protein [Candidatus Izimaplasma bacterium]